jgi:hypothetical protein
MRVKMGSPLDALYDPIPDAEWARLGIPPSGGWPIEPRWWRRQPTDFGPMLDWCELCGAALATPTRLATDHVQDVSPWHLERLKLIHSPAIEAGRLEVFGLGALDLDSKTQDLSPKTPTGTCPRPMSRDERPAGMPCYAPRRSRVWS